MKLVEESKLLDKELKVKLIKDKIIIAKEWLQSYIKYKIYIYILKSVIKEMGSKKSSKKKIREKNDLVGKKLSDNNGNVFGTIERIQYVDLSKKIEELLSKKSNYVQISGASVLQTKKDVDEIEKQVLEIHNKVTLLL